MFILDDILMAPFNGVMWVFKKIEQATREELENQNDRLKQQLTDLYMQLDTGRISEEEFDKRERELLDRLDKLKKAKAEEAQRMAAAAQQQADTEGDR